MNYLQLCNDLLLESGLKDSMATVNNRTDDELKATTWIRDAWLEIQRARLWDFMYAEGVFLCGTSDTITAANLTETQGVTYIPSSLVITYKGVPTTLLPAKYKDVKRSRTFTPKSGKPTFFGISPTKDIILYPASDDATSSLSYSYYSSPVTLLANEDTPILPTEFHKMITWKAVECYAVNEGGSAGDLYNQAIRNYNAIFDRLVTRHTGGYYE